MSTETFEKNRLGRVEPVEVSMGLQNRLRNNIWFKAMLVGLCVGLSYFVSDVIMRGM